MDYALESLIKIGIVFGIIITTVAYVVLAERKVSAYIQNRLGPNRVGPWGLLQPVADGLKFILKEDVIPNHVNKVVYVIAPAVILVPAATCLVDHKPTSWAVPGNVCGGPWLSSSGPSPSFPRKPKRRCCRASMNC